MHRLIIIILLPLITLAAKEVTAEHNKLVIAHYMTDMVPQTNRPLVRWIDPELADPNGSTAALGGLQQTIPMAPIQLGIADLTTAVDFEIRAARQLGVDGFQFYYPLGDNVRGLTEYYNLVVGEFIRLSESRYPGFKVSLCLAHPHTNQPSSQAERIAKWSEPIRSLVDATKNSTAWLRTDEGEILYYLWVGDALAEGVRGRANTAEEIQRVSEAYRRLSNAIGTPIQYVYQVRKPEIDPPYIDAIVKNFHAVWGWTASDENLEFWDHLAARCRKQGCLYTQSVYPDYYTSKAYRKGSDHEILSNEQAIELGINGIERHYRVTNLSKTQIQLLQRAVTHDVRIINYVTWNDFPEGHHLAPEQSHNFGPALLLRHFKEVWKSGVTEIDQDQAIVFYKKYRHDVRPKFSATLKIKSENKDVASEDVIELVTRLTEPAECFVNDHPLGKVDRGLQIHSIASEVGPVRVRVVRDGKTIISFRTPQVITDSPLRTDRLTYSYSSRFGDEFASLFPQND